jgi:glycosyltransferase involved in cell wall biosynthesis
VFSLDLVIATYRRPTFLRRALASIATAQIPQHLNCQVIVVDNDTTATAQSVVEEAAAGAPIPVLFLHEPAPGKSHALNRGIIESSAALVGFIDDDEEIDRRWFVEAETAFMPGDLDYIGGPTTPIWHSRPPLWIPQNYPAAIGIVDGGPHPRDYESDFPGILTGGNCIIARRVFERVGLYAPALGPRKGQRMFSCEDEDMYLRLLAAKLRGRYLPQLRVRHHVHPQRLTKGYYRRWSFWHGVAKAVLRKNHPEHLPSVIGVPRYVYRRAIEGALRWTACAFSRQRSSERFSAELATWDLAGHFYGRHWYRESSALTRIAPSLTEHKGCSDMSASLVA